MRIIPIALFIIVIAQISFASPVWINAKHVAIDGYDPVSYFTDSAAQRGDTALSAVVDSVQWLFTTTAHRDMFVKSPQKYMPQYDGYCAYGVSFRRRVITDPRVFTIKNDALYLNLNDRVNKRWSRRADHFIKRADRIWLRSKNTTFCNVK